MDCSELLRKFGWILLGSFVCATSLNTVARGNEKLSSIESKSPATNEELKELVSRLGASQFVVRENATMRLYDIGRQGAGERVMELLTIASKQGDREVKDRAQRVLVLLAEELKSKRLTHFLTGGNAAKIPGWKQFSAVYGDTKVSRGVFGEMLKHEEQFLAECFPADPEAAVAIRRIANDRFRQLVSKPYGYQAISLGSTLAFVFVGTEFPEFDGLFHLIQSNAPLKQQLRGAPLGIETSRGMIRSMVSKWVMVAVQENKRNQPLAINFTLGARLMDEAKMVATHVLKDEQSLPSNRRTAMQIFSALRDQAGVPLIQPFLEDKTSLRNAQEAGAQRQLQLRDVALTCLMDLSGHDLSAIGVKRQNNVLAPYADASLGFENDKEREKAFELFKELEAEKRYQERKAKEKRERSP